MAELSECQHGENIRRHLSYTKDPDIMPASIRAVNEHYQLVRAPFSTKGAAVPVSRVGGLGQARPGSHGPHFNAAWPVRPLHARLSSGTLAMLAWNHAHALKSRLGRAISCH